MPIFIVFLLSFIFFYLTWFYLDESRKRKHSPPGPPVFPFIGTVLHIALADPQPHLALVKLAEQYGDLCRVKLGPHEYVIVSSVEALNDLLSKDESLGRPDHGVLRERTDMPNIGVLLSNGDSWKTKRSWMVRTLREMGIGRTSHFEENTRLMINELHTKFQSDIGQSGKIVQVDRNLALCAATMMWRLLTGSNTPDDEADCKKFLHANDKWIEAGAFGDGLLLIAPFLKHIIPKLTGYSYQMEFFEVGRRLGKKWYEKLIPIDSDTPETFFHSYILEQKKGKTGFFEKDFNLTFNDIMTASVETSNSFIQTLLLFLTVYPEKQEKVYQEITSEVFAQDHVFTMSDVQLMPYTQAFMLEVHRLAMIATNWVPRMLTNDVSYRDFTLKKGTTLLPNPHSAFKSSIHFAPDPETFRPERYIDPNDPSKLTDLKKLVTPFSIGKRICPGEPVAQVVSFLTLVSTVKNFKLSCVPGEDPPSQEFIIGLTSRTRPFNVLVSPRL